MPKYVLSDLLQKNHHDLQDYCMGLYFDLLKKCADVDDELSVALDGIRINRYLFDDPLGPIEFKDFCFMITLMINGFRNNGFKIVHGRFTVIFD